MMIKALGLVIFLFCTTCAWGARPPCSSDIYCHGPLLHTIQMAHLYNDSKTFVDMKMKYTPDMTIELFNEMMKETNQEPSKSRLLAFVNSTFDPPGAEFESWTPSDWHTSPKFFNKIKDSNFLQWAKDLNALWLKLGRKMVKDVKVNNDHYSIIHVDHPVIVPGGRFREFYYWDSYWIVKGLILSEMTDTVKGMLTNFLSIVDRYGFIPNGGRVYYAMRSQPPLLLAMVRDYLEATNDVDFIQSNIKTLENEFSFWMNNRTVKVEKHDKSYLLAQYREASEGPRPESYREDVISAAEFPQELKNDFYKELKSAAESGWDFSTRWYINNGTDQGNLTNIKTRSVVPVDLNSIIYMNARILSDFFKLLHKPKKMQQYAEIAESWKEAIHKVLWNEEAGVWLDYDLINKAPRNYFYPSNLFPLWTEAYHLKHRVSVVSKVLHYFDVHKINDYLSGIPTSLGQSGEQWDFPNAWPPLQHVVIVGLANSKQPAAEALAYEWAKKWVRSNYKAYNETEAMFEKYDATIPGGHGGGGEYEVQLGFGWTNGVIMDLLNLYGERLTSKHNREPVEVIAAATPQ